MNTFIASPVLTIECYSPAGIPGEICDCGLQFIRRRFQEVWGIFRYDVTIERIQNRHNVVLQSQQGQVLGWLGIERDGELSNACLAHGLHEVSLIDLVKAAFRFTDFAYYYAETPIERTAAASSFVRAGMVPCDPPKLITILYPDRAIHLVKLECDKKPTHDFEEDRASTEDFLKWIGGLHRHVPAASRAF